MSAINAEQDTSGKLRIERAWRTAEEFTKLYYDSLDKKRHFMSRYYLDSGVLIWNGNASVGKDVIQKFFMSLRSSEHTLNSIDGQPILDSAVPGQVTVLMQVAGSVRWQGKPATNFHQSFIITAQGDKWKIVTDTFRHQVPVDLKSL